LSKLILCIHNKAKQTAKPQPVGGRMTANKRKRLIEALKAERARLNKMTDHASHSGNRLNSPELLHQSGIVGSLINDLDQQCESECREHTDDKQTKKEERHTQTKQRK
jgi:hypothetical protein